MQTTCRVSSEVFGGEALAPVMFSKVVGGHNLKSNAYCVYNSVHHYF